MLIVRRKKSTVTELLPTILIRFLLSTLTQQIGHYEPPNKTSGFTSCGKRHKSATCTLLACFVVFNLISCYRFAALSSSGRFILCGSDDNNIHIWDTMKVQHNGVLGGHENRVTSLSVAPNGMALASCSWDQYVRIWV